MWRLLWGNCLFSERGKFGHEICKFCVFKMIVIFLSVLRLTTGDGCDAAVNTDHLPPSSVLYCCQLYYIIALHDLCHQSLCNLINVRYRCYRTSWEALRVFVILRDVGHPKIFSALAGIESFCSYFFSLAWWHGMSGGLYTPVPPTRPSRHASSTGKITVILIFL